MNDSSASIVAGVGADAPTSKKAKLDGGMNSRLSPPRCVDDVSPRNFAQDGPRKGGLTLNIDDWNTFMQSADKVSSKPLTLSGVQFTMEVYVNDQSLAIWLHAAHTANRPEWHCKAEYALHWPRRARKDTKGLSTATIFRNGWTVSGWNARATLDIISRMYVRNNTLTLKMDVTTFSCQVTDGIYGHKLRSHDITFVFGDRRIYCNKGFLANHSEFFEGMFFGDFADRNKDEVELPTLAVDDFEYFLQAISAAALPLRPTNVLTILRMADRFQAHKLAESCVDFLISGKRTPAFVEQLQIADELSMTQFRDLLIETAANEELTEAAKAENEKEFCAETWMKLFFKYRELRPPV
ncbi:Protein BATH-38 [Aphelenchoides avenae]|nr:Protein BATH-38 [Aphelenchus avenae]